MQGQSLAAINAKLRAILSSWQSETAVPAAITPQTLIDLLADLHNAAELLRGVPSGSAQDPELEKVIGTYRQNVEQLEKTLPAIQGRLLAEKARLESVRAHLAAATAWAEARKKTL